MFLNLTIICTFKSLRADAHVSRRMFTLEKSQRTKYCATYIEKDETKNNVLDYFQLLRIRRSIFLLKRKKHHLLFKDWRRIFALLDNPYFDNTSD